MSSKKQRVGFSSSDGEDSRADEEFESEHAEEEMSLPADEELIEADTQELQTILDSLNETISLAQDKLKPLYSKAVDGSLPSTSHGIQYLEVKQHLMLMYVQFLSYFILLKVEGSQDIQDHPVIKRLTHIKLLFDKLKPLDAKLSYQVNKYQQSELGQQSALKYRPNLSKLQEQAALDAANDDTDSDTAVKQSKKHSEKDNVYKAPKTTSVAYSDDKKADKRSEQKD